MPMTTATYVYPLDIHEKARNYLEQGVLANQTVLIDTILVRFTHDDIAGIRRENIENLYDTSDDAVDEFLQLTGDLDEQKVGETSDQRRKLAEANGFEAEQKEVYERRLVTDRLATQLIEIGELVLSADSGSYR